MSLPIRVTPRAGHATSAPRPGSRCSATAASTNTASPASKSSYARGPKTSQGRDITIEIDFDAGDTGSEPVSIRPREAVRLAGDLLADAARALAAQDADPAQVAAVLALADQVHAHASHPELSPITR
ncbi:hypothetical protein [Nocardia aurantiaca]|uniref:Uncharacterized protein n=1 Tax=Nocardia aurantiaca TaxID=2675850 RepID=A0A6I3L9D5_9NOCA|nr:hypothetical protein [Nocardia aurantiaca]MTE17035.1 hypothetical protein [Nocardia aurantiaca]